MLSFLPSGSKNKYWFRKRGKCLNIWREDLILFVCISWTWQCVRRRLHKHSFHFNSLQLLGNRRHSINYNTDTELDVVFELFPGRVFTVTSTCTFIQVHLDWAQTHTGLLCTPTLEINQRRHLVRYMCCNLSMQKGF